jgi:hypothetical protein
MNPLHVERPLETSSIDRVDALGKLLPYLSGTPLAVPFPTIFWARKRGCRGLGTPPLSTP